MVALQPVLDTEAVLKACMSCTVSGASALSVGSCNDQPSYDRRIDLVAAQHEPVFFLFHKSSLLIPSSR